MKSKICLLLLTLTLICCKSSQKNIKSQVKQTFVISDIAKVQTVNGVEVFIMNTPLREYEVVQEIETTAKIKNILKEGSLTKNISDKVIQFISLARKLDINFDAVLYNSGKTLVCIKFKDNGSPETIGLAKVEKVSNLYAFVMCKPSQGYNVIGETDGGLKLGSIITLGMVSNSISEDVDKMLDNLKNNKGLEACIFYGNRGEAIKFIKE